MNLQNYILKCLIIENPIHNFIEIKDMSELECIYNDTATRIASMIEVDHEAPGKALYDSLSAEFGPEHIIKMRISSVYGRINMLRADPQSNIVKELSK